MNRAFSIGVICAGALIFYKAWMFPKSMFSPISPGAFPAVVGVGLFICGAILLSQSSISPQKSGYPAATSSSDGRREFVTGLILLAILAALAATFNQIGFLIASGLAATGLAYLQSQRIFVSIVTGAGIVSTVYVIFRLLLSVPLP